MYYVPCRMNCINFGGLLAFHQAPSSGKKKVVQYFGSNICKTNYIPWLCSVLISTKWLNIFCYSAFIKCPFKVTMYYKCHHALQRVSFSILFFTLMKWKQSDSCLIGATWCVETGGAEQKLLIPLQIWASHRWDPLWPLGSLKEGL